MGSKINEFLINLGRTPRRRRGKGPPYLACFVAFVMWASCGYKIFFDWDSIDKLRYKIGLPFAFALVSILALWAGLFVLRAYLDRARNDRSQP